MTAKGLVEWARTAGRVVAGHPDASPFVQMISAQRVDIRLEDEMAYELDGGDRPPTKRLRIETEPGAITICVPEVAS